MVAANTGNIAPGQDLLTATGLLMSGSEAINSTRNPGRTLKLAEA